MRLKERRGTKDEGGWRQDQKGMVTRQLKDFIQTKPSREWCGVFIIREGTRTAKARQVNIQIDGLSFLRILTYRESHRHISTTSVKR